MTPKAKTTSDYAEMGKLREGMLKWYCPKNAESPPCKTYEFMKKLRAASLDEKKQLLSARQVEMKARTPEEVKEASQKARGGYSSM